MTKNINNITTLYLPVSSKKIDAPHPPIVLTLCSRQKPISNKHNLPEHVHKGYHFIEKVKRRNTQNSKRTQTDDKSNSITSIEIPEIPKSSIEGKISRKVLLTAKPLISDDKSIRTDTNALYNELISSDTKLSRKKAMSNFKLTRDSSTVLATEKNTLFTFDEMFVLTFNDNHSPFLSACEVIPQFNSSLNYPQNLNEFYNNNNNNNNNNEKLNKYRSNSIATNINNKHSLICKATVSKPKSAQFTIEVPIIDPLKFDIQKANFAEINNISLPKCEEHTQLFSNSLGKSTHFCSDMLLTAYKCTAHVPSCLLFQPMKVPAVTHTKTRAFDLFRTSGIELLEENNDHQLFNIFLEPYWNSDRMFNLKKTMLNEGFSPVFPKKKWKKPSFLSLLRLSDLQKKAEQDENIDPLEILSDDDIPMPKIPDTKFSVDDSLSEFMKIRGKGTSSCDNENDSDENKKKTEPNLITTPLRRKKFLQQRKKRVVEEKSFFDVSCVLNLSEQFPLFPVLSRFLERYRHNDSSGDVLWITNESNAYDKFLRELFHKKDFTAVTVNSLQSFINKDESFLSKFSLIISGLSEINTFIKRNGDKINTHFQRQNTKTNFVVICDQNTTELCESVDFLNKVLNISYVMGNNSEDALNSIFHQQVIQAKIPSSISKEMTPFINSIKHARLLKALSLQNFDEALRIGSAEFPFLKRNVEILKLESEAGLFSNEALDAFSSTMLPVISDTLSNDDSLMLVVSNDNMERNFILGNNSIPENKILMPHNMNEIIRLSNSVLNKVACVFRIKFDWNRNECDCANDKILNEFLFYHLVHMRGEDNHALFFMIKFRLDGYPSRRCSTVLDWWNAQDGERIIYTSSLPEKSAFFYPISQIKRVQNEKGSSSLISKEEILRKALHSKPKRIILSISRGSMIKHNELFQDTADYVFAKRFFCDDNNEFCVIQTDFFSGVIAVFSNDFEKFQTCVEFMNAVISNNSLEDVVVVVWYEFVDVKKYLSLGEKCKILYFKDEDSLKMVLDAAINIQLAKTPNENSWVLQDETPYEKFLTSLNLSSFVAQYLLASFTLGKILTLNPKELCHRIDSDFLLKLNFFKIVRCAFDKQQNNSAEHSNYIIPNKQQKRSPSPSVFSFSPSSPSSSSSPYSSLYSSPRSSPYSSPIKKRNIESSPIKTKLLYELPKGNVLGQTKLKAMNFSVFSDNTNCGGDSVNEKVECNENDFYYDNNYDDDSYHNKSLFNEYPKRKAPKLTTVSTPIKVNKQQKEYRKEEICDLISNLYTYKGDEEISSNNVNVTNDSSEGKTKVNLNSPTKKSSNPTFTSKNTRLTFPKFDTMRKFPRITFKK